VDLSSKIVTRDALIKTLVEALKPLDYVHAFYESGAIAFNRLDEWSDLDLYVVVDDGRADDAFVAGGCPDGEAKGAKTITSQEGRKDR
jgi:predicted nucleotidyltransferase